MSGREKTVRAAWALLRSMSFIRLSLRMSILVVMHGLYAAGIYPAEGVPAAGNHGLLQRVVAHAAHATVQDVLLCASWQLAGGRSGSQRALRCGRIGAARGVNHQVGVVHRLRCKHVAHTTILLRDHCMLCCTAYRAGSCRTPPGSSNQPTYVQ